MEESPTGQGEGFISELSRLSKHKPGRFNMSNFTPNERPNMSKTTASSGEQHHETLNAPISEYSDRYLFPQLTPPVFRTDLSDGAFRMYSVMSILAQANQPVDRQRLADEMGVSRRTVFTRERELIEVGLIEVRLRYSDNGGNLPSAYTLREGVLGEQAGA